MLRVLLFVHRYLAVAVGLLMALWCLSGFVMLYQQYPTLTEAERLRGLPPLQFAGCCNGAFLADQDDVPVGDFSIQMQRGVPVLLQPDSPPFDLTRGTPLRPPTQQQLLDIAAVHAEARGISARPRWLGEGGVDQWTLLAARRDQQLAHVALDDTAGTELYIEREGGVIVQDTTRRERVLAWLGAIPHWLYPFGLRQHTAVWAQIVIWSAVVGTFLTLTGLYVGIARWQRRRNGRISPFRGWWYWHHIAGLIFGVLTLSWVASGLLTMTPWGLFEGTDAPRRIGTALTGSVPASELRRFLDEAPARLAGGGFVRLQSQPLGGHLYVIAERADGSAVRLNAGGIAEPLSGGDLRAALAGAGAPAGELSLLAAGDAYYYSHKETREFPAWRVILDDPPRTRVYVGAATGRFLVIDTDARRLRWLERGPHGMDFAGLRTRPLWDVVVLLLLAGVTAVAVTGAWMAIQRLRRDLSRS